jgi:hypothetical protein
MDWTPVSDRLLVPCAIGENEGIAAAADEEARDVVVPAVLGRMAPEETAVLVPGGTGACTVAEGVWVNVADGVDDGGVGATVEPGVTETASAAGLSPRSFPAITL